MGKQSREKARRKARRQRGQEWFFIDDPAPNCRCVVVTRNPYQSKTARYYHAENHLLEIPTTTAMDPHYVCKKCRREFARLPSDTWCGWPRPEPPTRQPKDREEYVQLERFDRMVQTIVSVMDPMFLTGTNAIWHRTLAWNLFYAHAFSTWSQTDGAHWEFMQIWIDQWLERQ